MLRVGRFLLFYDLTIGKAQATIHVGSVWNPPNLPNSPAPDLTQTGAKTQWIYRDLFDKIARIYYFQSFFEYFNGGCKLQPPLRFHASDRVSDGVSDRVRCALFHTGCRVDIGAEREPRAEVTQCF